MIHRKKGLSEKDQVVYNIFRMGADTDLNNGLRANVVEQVEDLINKENYIAVQAVMDSIAVFDEGNKTVI